MNAEELTLKPHIRVLETHEDRSKLRRFWYDTYVTEMGRDQEFADHEKKELDDPRATKGIVVTAFIGDEVVGTLICTPSWSNALGDYESLYSMSALGPSHPNTTGIITKLMVAPEYRHSMLSIRLSQALYRYAVPLGVHHVVIDCNDYLVPFFLKLGFKPWGESVTHPSYGDVHVLKLDCLDLPHLISVKSPLLPVAEKVAPTVLALPDHLRKTG